VHRERDGTAARDERLDPLLERHATDVGEDHR
jgi:hypothetical protein